MSEDHVFSHKTISSDPPPGQFYFVFICIEYPSLMSKLHPLGHNEISPFKNPIDFFFKSLNIRTVFQK